MQRETPAPVHVLERLAAEITQGGDPSFWAGVDMDFLRPHLGRAAQGVLTERQWQILSLRLAGYTETQIANQLSISQPVVHKTIFGDQGRGGALKKLKEVLERDDAFLAALAQARQEAGADDSERVLIINWFRDVKNGGLNVQFVPLAVLLILYFLKDQRHRVRHDLAMQHLPRPAITHALSILRPLGYVDTDGITMTIRKTPLGALV